MDEELLEETKQIDTIFANSLTTSGPPQASPAIEELAAL